ncbi:MAG: hypothetical protein Q8J70_07155 [Thiobacillus sp.]|nr:hypothetical protein [Thiobacillus sp.]
MHKRFWSRPANWLSGMLLICTTGVAGTAMAKPDPAATLRAKYLSLEESLQQNQFKQQLVLDSAELPSRLTGDIHAIVDYPFAVVNAGLNNPKNWCDVMLLHLNTKYCHAAKGPSGTVLKVNIGKKTPEELADAARVKFNYSVATATPEYFDINLNARDGPLGTSDFIIRLEAVALPNAKTFLHLTYSYAISFSGRLAMQTYLGTVGSHKVGFTVIGKQADGKPDYIRGVRGLMERNTMRYYLAIDSFLGATRTAPAARFEKRLQNWFTAAERYPRQLHEMDRRTYVEMKRAEHVRQQTVY